MGCFTIRKKEKQRQARFEQLMDRKQFIRSTLHEICHYLPRKRWAEYRGAVMWVVQDGKTNNFTRMLLEDSLENNEKAQKAHARLAEFVECMFPMSHEYPYVTAPGEDEKPTWAQEDASEIVEYLSSDEKAELWEEQKQEAQLARARENARAVTKTSITFWLALIKDSVAPADWEAYRLAMLNALQDQIRCARSPARPLRHNLAASLSGTEPLKNQARQLHNTLAITVACSLPLLELYQGLPEDIKPGKSHGVDQSAEDDAKEIINQLSDDDFPSRRGPGQAGKPLAAPDFLIKRTQVANAEVR